MDKTTPAFVVRPSLRSKYPSSLFMETAYAIISQ